MNLQQTNQVMSKNTKKNHSRSMKNRQLRITISNDHFEALLQMQERSGFKVSSIGASVFRAGFPEFKKRYAVDVETN